MHVESETLVGALRDAGMRVTRPRREVCEVVAARHAEHLTAAAIADHLEGVVDQATVYRTLEALERTGVLSHTHLGHGASVYHLAGDEPHQHVVCEECGRVESLDHGLFDDLVDAVRHATGFEVDAAHFALLGRCSRCAGLEVR